MSKKVEAVLDGCLGSFVEIPDIEVPDLQTAKDRPGFIRLNDGRVETKLMLDDAFGRTIEAPHALVGATEGSGILCLGIASSNTTRAYAGGRVSYATHSFDTLLAGVDIFSLRSTRLKDAAVSFHGEFTNAWAGVETISTEMTTDSESRVQAVSINLRSLPGVSAVLGDQVLEVKPHWNVKHSSDGSPSIDVALEIRATSDQPADAKALLEVLYRVQELLGIAFNGFLPASAGRATCDGSDDRAELWNSALMGNETKAVAKPGFRTDFLFSISQMGGVDGIVRWVELCRQHPRAVAPVTNRVRVGRTGAELHLMELCSAIEYWVAARRRTEPNMGSGNRYVEPLALGLGPAMATWVGDVRRWSSLVWRYYTGLKHHIPDFKPDRRTLILLANSTYCALIAALLNRSALSSSPGDALLADLRLSGIGRGVRSLWSNSSGDDGSVDRSEPG